MATVSASSVVIGEFGWNAYSVNALAEYECVFADVQVWKCAEMDCLFE